MASSASSSSLARPASSTARAVATALGLGMVAVAAAGAFILGGSPPPRGPAKKPNFPAGCEETCRLGYSF